MKKFIALLVCIFADCAAFALDVAWDKRTPEGHRQWADRGYLHEQMEVAGRKICEALYGEEPRSRLHENFTAILYLAPVRGGNPAFASGRRITWKVGEHPSGSSVECPGILVHEMTHILDMGSDRVFTEAMADWVRYYRVCANPADVLNRRYGALRGSRHYGKYAAGANFVDFMTQNYGEGTIYRILKGYAEHHGAVWEKLFGKTLDGLVAEWRQMETIHDPVWQWTYNGTSEGKERHDGKYCGRPAMLCAEAADKSGVWLDGSTAWKVNNLADGNITLAMHGRFQKSGKVAIASLGTAKEGSGKAILLSTGGKDALAAHVIASVPGKGRHIVSTTPVPLSGLAAEPHSVVLTVKGGDEAVVVVDGKPAAKIDMKSKCAGCTFTPAFAIGGMSGGFGVAGFAEPNGKGGILIDDVRVFNRAYRSRETKQYCDTFNADYRGAVAVSAKWCGKTGDAIDDTAKWQCFNSLGERIWVLPSKETAVMVSGRNLPSIPQGAKFACKSFTIDGWAVADEANIDLRGVRIVDVADLTRLITRNGHGIAVNALRGNRLRLDGSLGVTGGMKLTGKLEMREGSVLRLPGDPEMAQVKSIAIKGDGTVTLKPGTPAKFAVFKKLLRLEEMPEDLTRFRLDPSDKPEDAEFKPAAGSKFLGVTSKRR